MTLRSTRERVIQTLAFEAGGVALSAPLYGFLLQRDAADSVTLMALLSFALLAWTPAHNTLFDVVEWWVARRLASDRPHGLRLAHAASLEVSRTLVSLPFLIVFGGHGFWEALAVDLGLTALFIAYGYGFHLAFDRLRPVSPNAFSPEHGDCAIRSASRPAQ